MLRPGTTHRAAGAITSPTWRLAPHTAETAERTGPSERAVPLDAERGEKVSTAALQWSRASTTAAHDSKKVASFPKLVRFVQVGIVIRKDFRNGVPQSSRRRRLFPEWRECDDILTRHGRTPPGGHEP